MSLVMRHVLRNIWAYMFLALGIFWLATIGFIVLIVWFMG